MRGRHEAVNFWTLLALPLLVFGDFEIGPGKPGLCPPEAQWLTPGSGHPGFPYWRCGGGLCIYTEYRCDGQRTCNDGSDEVGCEAPTPVPIQTRTAPGSTNEVQEGKQVEAARGDELPRSAGDGSLRRAQSWSRKSCIRQLARNMGFYSNVSYIVQCYRPHPHPTETPFYERLAALDHRYYHVCVDKIKGLGGKFFILHAGNVQIGMCGPLSCDNNTFAEAVEHTQLMTTNKLAMVVALSGCESVFKLGSALRVDGTVPIEALNVSFVVAGFPRCATSALQHLLLSRPDISMPPDEDQLGPTGGLFVRNPQPFASATLSSRVHEAFRGFKQGRIRGIKDPFMIYSEEAMVLLAKQPQVKVVVTLREPLRFLESWFDCFIRPLDANGTTIPENVVELLSAITPVSDDSARRYPGQCVGEMLAATGQCVRAVRRPNCEVSQYGCNDMHAGLARFAHWVRRAEQLLGDSSRLLVVTQHELQTSASRTLDRILRFIGADKLTEPERQAVDKRTPVNARGSSATPENRLFGNPRLADVRRSLEHYLHEDILWYNWLGTRYS